MTDPDTQALIERLRAFLEYCNDTSLPRPADAIVESIPTEELEAV